MPERTLVVKFLGDDRQLQQTFTRAERRTKEFDARTNKTVQGIRGGLSASLGTGGGLLFGSTAFVASAAVTAGLEKAVSDASDLNEQITKSQQIFKGASEAVNEWSRTTADAFGISREAALEAAGTFGNLLNTVGLAPDVAAKMSQSLVQLAADLASFNNASPEDTLAAIRSGLVGEAEPLRRYGVLLSESRVQQRAMADTGKSTAKALTDQEKALARYEIILEDTIPAQGDFARTSDGLANQQRQLKANIDDLSAEIGGVLIPKLQILTEVALGAFNALDKLGNVRIGGTSLTSVFGWVSGWKEFDWLVEHSYFNMRKLHVETENFLRLPKPLDPLGVTGITRPVPSAFPAAPTDPFAELEAQQRRDRLEAGRRNRRAAREFNAFVSGMGLKLDKAGLTAGLDDDLAALRELERGIQRRIAREGHTFELEKQLTSVRQQIADTLGTQALDASQAASDAFNDAIDALDLKLEKAQVTRGFDDDLAALREIERTILARIQAEGRTTDLLRQLFENRQAQAEAIRNERNRQQFLRLGLDETGAERTPSTGTLRKRLRSIREQVRGTSLDTSKTGAELDRIAAVLSGKFGKVGKDVRAAILRMLDDISSALESGDKSTGPLTKFSKRGADALIRGLGLTTRQAREIAQRFSTFNRFDLSGGAGAPPRGERRIVEERGRGEIIVHVYIDGKEVETRVTKRQQKTRGRTRPQRRGTRPGV